MNELIFSDARLKFISSLDKKSRIVIMAYENYCNHLEKMSKVQELNHFTLNKSLNLTLESILLFLNENDIQVSRQYTKYSTISENTNDFNSTSSSENSDSSGSSNSYSSDEEAPDIEEANHFS